MNELEKEKEIVKLVLQGNINIRCVMTSRDGLVLIEYWDGTQVKYNRKGERVWK